jgi:hypothetical protein
MHIHKPLIVRISAKLSSNFQASICKKNWKISKRHHEAGAVIEAMSIHSQKMQSQLQRQYRLSFGLTAINIK